MRVTQVNNNTASIKFYGDINAWYNNAEQFTSLIEDLAAKYDNIEVRAHSYGGSVFEGTAIYNTILNTKANTTLYVDGLCASMMSIVALAFDKVVMADNAYLMVHAPSAETFGGSKAHAEAAKLLQLMEQSFTKRYAEKTGKKAKDAAKYMDGTNHWFSAEQALSEGLIDEIAPAVVKNVKALDADLESGNENAISDMYARYAALLTDENKNSNTQIPDNMKKLLITMFALANVTENSSDEDVAKAMKEKMDGLQNQINAQSKAQIDAVIAAHEQASGKQFDDKMKAVLQDIGEKAGITALQASLGLNVPAASAATQQAPPPAVPTVTSMLQNKGAMPDDRSGWDWDKWQSEDPDGLMEKSQKDYDGFNALYKKKYKTDAPR